MRYTEKKSKVLRLNDSFVNSEKSIYIIIYDTI